MAITNNTSLLVAQFFRDGFVSIRSLLTELLYSHVVVSSKLRMMFNGSENSESILIMVYHVAMRSLSNIAGKSPFPRGHSDTKSWLFHGFAYQTVDDESYGRPWWGLLSKHHWEVGMARLPAQALRLTTDGTMWKLLRRWFDGKAFHLRLPV